MKRWYSSLELTGLPGLPSHRGNITRKALAEGWHFQQRNGRGGGREYAYESLPAQTQAALHKSDRICQNYDDSDDETNKRNESVSRKLTPTEASAIAFETIDNQPSKLYKQAPKVKAKGGLVEQRTDAWLEIIKAYETWCESSNCNSVLIRDLEFAKAYNDRQLRLANWVYQYVPQISRSTLKAKNKCRRTANSLQALGGNYGNRKGKGKIDSNPELKQAIETCIAVGGKHWGAIQIYEILLLEFGYESQDFSLGQLRSWIGQFRAENPQKWSMYMQPDRFKGMVAPAFGSRSYGVVRPNQVWEIDSLNVDLILKYQCQLSQNLKVKRYSLIGCIDLFTRRAMLLLSDTSKAEAVCQLLAAAILKWGVPEGVRTDWGKEYLSRRVKRFLSNLDIHTDDLRCLPGHPEQKPFIERFNRTFQHRDLPKLPGFVGHNVAERQAIRANPDWNKTAVELAMMPEEFQTWCDAWCIGYERRSHGRPGIGLEGKSPLEVLTAAAEQGWSMAQISNPRDLDFLMMAAPTKDGTRMVGRQGISVNGRLYVAGELGGWIGKRVYVCFSPQDLTYIYIYKSSSLTQYICKAFWREAKEIDLAQIARQATVAYELIRQQVNQTCKRGQSLLRKIATNPISVLGNVQEVLPLVQSHLHDYPALSAIALAIASTEPQNTQPQISDQQYQAELAQLEAVEAEQLNRQQQAIALSMQLEKLFEFWQQGGDLTEIPAQSLAQVATYLESSQGKGYLGAIADCSQQEYRFSSWLARQQSKQPVAVDSNQLLMAVFDAWSKGLEASAQRREFLAHYIQLAAGKGTLNALIEDKHEQQRFLAWLSQSKTLTVQSTEQIY
ncbi:hypothetical protein C7B79_09665 [Chroococcidiopsis cubana CCALA 043]|uniref:Mu transposase C-terminal domain-containing protein n=1 Tax=Chroococcidiopsis cubana TaxID=171392 RepID=UPI000D0856F0|nr:Mu transposase C-terminal domain-containing protein [Chroococcidiopsis cubana]PSB64449.1 hypothetical protein C7B79_09665 [Chroococcidiopsis cubana CCALA 043]